MEWAKSGRAASPPCGKFAFKMKYFEFIRILSPVGFNNQNGAVIASDKWLFCLVCAQFFYISSPIGAKDNARMSFFYVSQGKYWVIRVCLKIV